MCYISAQWAASTSKRKKLVADMRTRKRSRVHVDDGDKDAEQASEPEEGNFLYLLIF